MFGIENIDTYLPNIDVSAAEFISSSFLIF